MFAREPVQDSKQKQNPSQRMAIDLERLKMAILKHACYPIVFLKRAEESKTKVQLLLKFTEENFDEKTLGKFKKGIIDCYDLYANFSINHARRFIALGKCELWNGAAFLHLFAELEKQNLKFMLTQQQIPYNPQIFIERCFYAKVEVLWNYKPLEITYTDNVKASENTNTRGHWVILCDGMFDSDPNPDCKEDKANQVKLVIDLAEDQYTDNCEFLPHVISYMVQIEDEEKGIYVEKQYEPRRRFRVIEILSTLQEWEVYWGARCQEIEKKNLEQGFFVRTWMSRFFQDQSCSLAFIKGAFQNS